MPVLLSSPHHKPLSSSMQHNSVTNIPYHTSLDYPSFFLTQGNLQIHDLDSPQSVGLVTCHGTTRITSTSVEVNHQERRIKDERKARRLVSNRESARRSRMRKQRQLDEMSSQVAHLRTMNQRLVVELNHMIAKHGHIVQENVQLREEASVLQRKLSEIEAEGADAEPKAP